MNLGAWWWSDRLVLRMHGAREISEAAAPELYGVVRALAQRARIPMPLNEVTKAGVLIDVCDRCLGTWLERGELEKITARLRQLEHDMADDGRRPLSREPAWRDDDDDRRAPRRRRWSDVFDIFD